MSATATPAAASAASRTRKTRVVGAGASWTSRPHPSAPIASPVSGATPLTTPPRRGASSGWRSIRVAPRVPTAAPVATPWAIRAASRSPTPSAAMKHTRDTASSAIAAASTGRRPTWSDKRAHDEQRGEERDRVDREDLRQRGAREAPGSLIDGVERRRRARGGEERHDHGGGGPERGRAPEPGGACRDAGVSHGRAAPAPRLPRSSVPGQRQRQVELGEQVAQHVPHALPGRRAPAPTGRAGPSSTASAPKRERLDDVGAAADAAVEQHRRCRRPTASTTPGSASSAAIAPSTCRPPWFETITPSTPCSRALARIVGMEDALQEDRQRRSCERSKREVVPGQRRVGERRRAKCPTARLRVLLRRLRRARAEDRVGEVVARCPSPWRNGR